MGCFCTHILDDDAQLSASQSFARDVAVLRSRILTRKMPVVWLLGDSTSVSAHAASVAERFGFACLDAARISKEESAHESSRGRLVRGKTAQGKRVPDRTMVDLIKEHMVTVGDTRGYLLAGFPLTPKQAQLFTKELTSVDCVVLLHSPAAQPADQQPTTPGYPPCPGADVMLEGDSKGVGDKKQNKDKDKDKEEEAVREIVEAAQGKWDLLVEKINMNEPPADIFLKIEAAILDRTSTNKI